MARRPWQTAHGSSGSEAYWRTIAAPSSPARPKLGLTTPVASSAALPARSCRRLIGIPWHVAAKKNSSPALMPDFTAGGNVTRPASSVAEKLPHALLPAADRELDHLIRRPA